MCASGLTAFQIDPLS